MENESRRNLIAYLPVAFAATFMVLVVPVLLVFWLRTSGTVDSVWLGTLVGVVASFLLSYAGGAFWKTRTDSRDILFSELMPWGWVQRWRSERRLASASDLLGLKTGRPIAISGGALTNEQISDLLTQLSSGLEASDPYTHGHSRRVARHAANIAKRMGLAPDEVAKIRAAGTMHDVGKVETPTAVLHKEGKLTDEEFDVVKRHPVDGARMVASLEDDQLTAMVRHHHERIDGTGYPDGLAGDAIPLGARILSVADTFDAITSTRPYRHAFAHKKALDILAAEAGTQLDPDAVRAFCSGYSGRRPLTYWTILAHGRPRLLSFFGGGLSSAKAASGNVMAAAATAATVGGVALVPIVDAPVRSRAIADTPPSTVAAKVRSGPQPGERSSPRSSSPAAQGRPGDRQTRGQKPKRSAAKVPAVSAPAPSPVVYQPPTVPAVVETGGPAPVADGPQGETGQGDGSKPTKPQKGPGNGKDKGTGKGKETGKGKDTGKAKGKVKDKNKVKDKDKVKDKVTGKDNGNGNGNGQGKDKSGDKDSTPKERDKGQGLPKEQGGAKGNGNGNGKGGQEPTPSPEPEPAPGEDPGIVPEPIPLPG